MGYFDPLAPLIGLERGEGERERDPIGTALGNQFDSRDRLGFLDPDAE